MYDFALATPSRWGLPRRVLGMFLVLSLALGTVAISDVWAATYYVNAATGNDGNSPAQAQNPGTPWKTITRAIGEATLVPTDVISVAAGTYDQANGETFPLYLVDGVDLQGAGAGSSIIRGPANADVFSNEDTPLGPGTRLAGFTLDKGDDSSYYSLLYLAPEDSPTTVLVENNTFSGNYSGGAYSYGAYVYVDTGSTASFDGTFRGNTFDDLYYGANLENYYTGPASSVALTVDGGTFSDNYYGFYNEVSYYVQGTHAVTVAGATFTGSDYGIYEYQYPGYTGSATVTNLYRNNTFTDNTDHVEIYDYAYSMSYAIDITTTVDNNTFSGGDYGVYFDYSEYDHYDAPAGFHLTVSNNTFTGMSAPVEGYLTSFSASSEGSASLDLDVTIAGNTMTGAADGVYLSMSSLSDGYDADITVTVANNTITSPTDDGISLSFTELSAYDADDDMRLSVTLSGNTVTDAGDDGIYYETSYGYSLTRHHVTVEGNTVSGAENDGISIYLYSASDVADYDVQVQNNVVTGNGYDGIYLYSYHDETGNPGLVACNTSTGNANDGLYGYSGYSEAWDFGGGGRSAGNNSLFDNTSYDAEGGSEGGDTPGENNWWNTTNPGTIAGNVSGVDYDPFLSAAPGVSADLPLTDALVVDADASGGPSIGDTIGYTAIVTATGACGCASGVFTAPIPANATVVAGSVTTSDGNVTGENPVTVAIGNLQAAGSVTISWEVTADSGTELATQASFTCTQLGAVASDDPDTGTVDDPTVTPLGTGGYVPPVIQEIPTLGQWGLGALFALLSLVGLVQLRRRRGAAALLLAVALAASASAAGAAQSKAAGKPRSTERPSVEKVATAVQPTGEQVRIVFADGSSVTAPGAQVRMSPRPAQPKAERLAQPPRSRGPRDGHQARALGAGEAAVVKVQTDAATGEIRRVQVKVFPSAAEAHRFLDERATRRAAAEAARATGERPAAAAAKTTAKPAGG